MIASQAAATAASRSERLAALRERLVPPLPASEVWGWAGPLLVTALGAFLRFNRLSVPRTIIFDETYYVPDALGILRYGAEHNYVSSRNSLLTRGDTHIFTRGGEFAVHPPAGKLLIAAGEWLFGVTPFGWRFAVAVLGSLSILLLARITRRMTRSTLLGCVAGFLLALDGLAFVLSRTTILDPFVMFWVLAGFGCLVVDRDRFRLRLAQAVADGGAEVGGPRLGIRWWRVAAGVCLGLACASKWNGVYFIPVFAAMCLAWDIGARRAAGVPSPVAGALSRDGSWLPVSLGAVPFVTYLVSWTGWFVSGTGYDRNWAAQHGIHTPVISELVSLYQYHLAMLNFNVGLREHHPYQSQPWSWLTLGRPVAFFWVCPTAGHGACSAGNAQEVLAIGTPLIWWASIPALLVCLGWWLTRRDWRAGAVLAGVAAGWLPWFLFLSRTKFYFYAISFEPFLILAITLCLGLLIGPAAASARRRAVGAAVAGAYLLGVLLDFAYLYPVLSGQVISYGSWLARMWYHGWI
jgi:dolichyl-phosphate-mannose--protein O-mannosyl transferase